MKKIFIILFLLVFCYEFSFSDTHTAVATGNWGTAGTWSPASVPASTDNAIIPGTYTVSVAANASITDVTIQSGGYLKTGTSGSGANKTITVSGIFTINANGTYEHNNNQAASTTIFAGTESFDNASNFIVSSWSNVSTSIVTGCGSSFGNLTIAYNPGGGTPIWFCNGLGVSPNTVNGNFTVTSGGSMAFSNAAGDVTITIGGNFTPGDLTVGKYNASGNITFNVGGDVIVNDGIIDFWGCYAAGSTGNFTLNTTNYTQTVTTSDFWCAYNGANGAVSVNITNNFSTNGTFYGANVGDGNVSMTVANNMTVSGGLCFLSRDGLGNVSLTVNGTYSQSAGDCRGNYNLSAYGTGTSTYNIGTINFTGGVFMANYACHTAGATSTFNVTNNCTINFSATGDIFRIIGLGKLSSTYNNSPANFTVGGTLTISGAAGGFSSDGGAGNETNSFQSVTISGGTNNFNPTIDAGNAHNTTTAINGDLTISGGTTDLSQNTGTLTGSITGNVSISAGTLNTSTDATSNLNLTVGTASVTWAQTGGTVSLCNTNIKTGKTITMTGTKMGDIQASRTITIESGGTLNCSNYPVSGAGNFTLATAATLGIGSLAGIESSGAVGNVQVTGTRSYNSGATYRYYEGLTPQSTGNFTTTPTASTVANLIMDKTNITDIVNLTNTTDVTGILTLTKGVFTTQYDSVAAGYVRIKTGASVSPAGGSANSYVDGFIRKEGNTNFIFPTGNSGKWRRISIDSISAVSEFAARYIYSPYVNTINMAAAPTPVLTHVSSIEHWILNKPGVADTCYVTLYWEDAAASGILKFDSLVVARWNATAWENTHNPNPDDWTSSLPERKYTGTLGIGGVGYIRSNLIINTFSPFTFGSIGKIGQNPLPIELLYFTAVCLSPSGGSAGGEVSVNWATASETNNDYFTVERSLSPFGGGAGGGGFNWETIGIVPGNGNSNNANVYNLTDNAPYTGVGYYRIKQTDFDGAFEYFQPVAVSCDDSQLLSFDISNVYTDDAGNLNITFTYPANGENCNFSLYNAMGQQIFSESKKSVQGLNRISFNFNDFAKGIYLITLTNSEKTISHKVLMN